MLILNNCGLLIMIKIKCIFEINNNDARSLNSAIGSVAFAEGIFYVLSLFLTFPLFIFQVLFVKVLYGIRHRIINDTKIILKGKKLWRI